MAIVRSIVRPIVRPIVNPVTDRYGGSGWASYCTPLSIDVIQITGGNRVTWTDNPLCTDEDGYEVWVNIDGGAYALLDTVAAGVGQYDDMVDYAGSQVTYKVRAYKGASYSAFTAESEIVIEPDIENLAVVWLEDHAVITFDGVAGWQTELYSSLDNITYNLVTTIADGTETYTDHTWQGTTVYYKARAKQGVEYGDYCAAISIATPLVFKFDCNPTATLGFAGHFGLPAGKTVRVSWGSFNGGVEYYTDYTTTTTPGHNYLGAGEGNQDPCYIKISGDLNFITQILLQNNSLIYGDISKWVLPSGVTKIYLFTGKYSGDLSNWIIPASLTDLRLYNTGVGQNTFTGDLSGWSLPATMTICYLAYNAFTAPPRGELKGMEAATAGLYMRDCSCNTAAIDAFLAYANTYFATNTPIKNSLFQLGISATTNMGIPTGGNNNTNRLGIIAKYVAAGFTATVTVRTA